MTLCCRPAVAVCIPVRDEATRLPRLLKALAQQSDLPPRFQLCLVFDGCQDESERIATAAAHHLPFPLETKSLPRQTAPHAGRARRAAMALGQQFLDSGEGLLLTTDADSVPQDDWVAANCRALAEVDIVAGHIVRTSTSQLIWRDRHERYLNRLHVFRRTLDPIEHDPLPSHPSLGGASLGMRASVYEALGGFPFLASGEDVTFVSQARRHGYRIRHDPAVRVITSGRTRGRARGGLADELNLAKTRRGPPVVPDPSLLAGHFRLQADLRRAFDDPEPEKALMRVAYTYKACPASLRHAAQRAANSDAFVEHVAADLPAGRAVPLPLAEELLDQLEKHYCSQRTA